MGPGFDSPLAHTRRNSYKKSPDIIKMLPRYNSKITQDLDVSMLEYPPERILSAKGLIDNIYYTDERGWRWKGFLEIYEIEKKLVSETKKEAKNEKEFDWILQDSTSCNDIFPPLNFESGISSITVAMSALGCAPASSCRCHPFLNKNNYSPHVTAWATRHKAEEILSSAKGLEIAVRNRKIGGSEGLIVYSNDVITLLDFSKKLYDDHKN